MDPTFSGLFGVDPFAAMQNVATTAQPAAGNSGGFLSGFLDTVNQLGNTAATGYKNYLAATTAPQTAQAAASAAAAKSNASATFSKVLPYLAIGALVIGGIALAWKFFKRK